MLIEVRKDLLRFRLLAETEKPEGDMPVLSGHLLAGNTATVEQPIEMGGDGMSIVLGQGNRKEHALSHQIQRPRCGWPCHHSPDIANLASCSAPVVV